MLSSFNISECQIPVVFTNHCAIACLEAGRLTLVGGRSLVHQPYIANVIVRLELSEAIKRFLSDALPSCTFDLNGYKCYLNIPCDSIEGVVKHLPQIDLICEVNEPVIFNQVQEWLKCKFQTLTLKSIDSNSPQNYEEKCEL